MPKSGFCSVGHHEGGRYPGPSGRLNKTCTLVDICTCDDPTCHRFFDEMFRQAEMPRQVVDNSGYEAEAHTFTMPERTVLAAPSILSNSAPVDSPDTLESVAPGVVPPVKRAAYAPTSSGRAARGELEHQVNQTCITYSVEGYRMHCTPQYVSQEIAREYGIKAPSTGAVDAVFKRWEEIGYAVIERKPTRFVKFTEQGVELGLDQMKYRAKHQHKSKQAALNRGERV